MGKQEGRRMGGGEGRGGGRRGEGKRERGVHMIGLQD